MAEENITQEIKSLIVGDPVQSITLSDLISYSKANDLVVKMDIEVIKHHIDSMYM